MTKLILPVDPRQRERSDLRDQSVPRQRSLNPHRQLVTRSKARPSTGFRPDIEGLRAVAVLLVIAGHLSGWPRGGFVGVDVFFVISGYLITGLLLREAERAARVSLKSFYARRARRILPASLTVLAVAAVANQVAFSGARVREGVSAIWWALGFAANIHFADTGTDYFQATRPPSLVQHFWSLAVEEQFYLVWPLVIVLVVALVGRRRGPAATRRVLFVLALAATAASFAYAVSQTKSDPTAAYFSTPARAWELGVGAVIAIALAHYPQLAGRLGWGRPILSALALTAVAGSALWMRSDTGFPGPNAALAVVPTGVLIAAGAGAHFGRWDALLTNPVSRYIGRISYSLYLWHWPVIVLVGNYVPRTNGAAYYPTALLLMAGLSVFSCHFIEQPMRHLTLRRSRHWWRRESDRRPRLNRELRLASLASLALIVTASILWQSSSPTLPPSQFLAYASPTTTSAAGALPDDAPRQKALTTELSDALTADKWPALNPTMTDEQDGKEASDAVLNCAHIQLSAPSSCVWGSASAKHTVYVVGDSTSMAYAEALIKVVAGTPGWRLRYVGAYGCSFTVIVQHMSDSSIQNGCAPHNAAVIAEIESTRPDLVLVSNTYSPGVAADTGRKPAIADWSASAQTELKAIAGSAKQVAVIAPPPNGGGVDGITTCDRPGSTPAACVYKVPAAWTERLSDDQANADAGGQTVIDAQDWFCVSGYCPAFAGSTPTRHDVVHASYRYAQQIAPVIAERLSGLGLLRA